MADGGYRGSTGTEPEAGSTNKNTLGKSVPAPEDLRAPVGFDTRRCAALLPVQPIQAIDFLAGLVLVVILGLFYWSNRMP